MKIVSDFHDYYDVVRQYGVDPKLLYIRKTQELEEYVGPADLTPLKILLERIPHQVEGINTRFERGLIAFCGRAHPFLRCRGSICYTTEHLVAALRKRTTAYDVNISDDPKVRGHLIKQIISPSSPKQGRHRKHWVPMPPYLTAESWSHLLHSNLGIPDELHRALDCPVLLFGDWYMNYRYRYTFILNPRLNKWEFFRAVGPVEAYQKLSMYVGNNLVHQRDPEVGLTDEMRRDTAGFDKWSFKKQGRRSKP
jgi:hypothetical protein